MPEKTIPVSPPQGDTQLNIELKNEVKRKTRDLKLTLTKLEEYSKTLELKISERTEELENALQLIEEEKDRLKVLAEAAPIGIGLIENDRLKWVNEEMLTMFRSEMKHQYHEKALSEFFPSEEVFIEFFQKIDSQLRAEKTADEDIALKRDDGSVFIGHIRLSCQDPLHPLDKAVVTVSDITWREQVAIERMKKEKLKGVIETSGAVCHELNQPLQSILGLAELVMMNIKEDDPHYGKMKKIKAQVERMGDITKKIMGITTYETMEYLDSRIIDINKASE
jgi:C4-dicarboxylate-specific signal transduction histidine kinase